MLLLLVAESLAPDSWSDIVQFVAAGGVGIVIAEFVRGFIHRKGMNADTAKTITDAAITLVDPLQKRVVELEGELRSAEQHAGQLDIDLKDATATVVALTREVVALTGQVQELTRELRKAHEDTAAALREVLDLKRELGRNGGPHASSDQPAEDVEDPQ